MASDKRHTTHPSHSQSDDAASRQALRKVFKQKRLAQSPAEQQQSAQQLVERYKENTLFRHAQHVALYLSFNGEINTRPLIDYLWSIHCQVYVPVLHPFCKGHLLFQVLTPDTVMLKNHYGIEEPKLNIQGVCPIAKLDLIFTPLLAFDLTGNRLGMGGGFYDRTLAQLNKMGASSPTTVVGLAHEVQLSAPLPTQAWDIPLPYILTSNKLYSFR